MVDSTRLLSASNAYNNTINRNLDTPKGGPTDAAAPVSSGFSDLVGNALDSVSKAARAGELTGTQSLLGKIGPDELAAAVTNAELTLRTVTAIRDKIIGAYQDIIKMPI